ncbi:metastasis-associated protein MTA [Anopheles darlingi]|uniref:Metastasis-associated protein MTA n=1 Tax=Anopheles darlingi TaxID=43151 RepID=W5J4W5_ANODA|nr:metastasis-associated protein MTA [Anopheles darlingi]
MSALEEERNSPNNTGGGGGGGGGGGSERGEHLNPKQRHQMKQRELFLSRQVETLPATQIRAKCSVTLLNEEESLLSYLNKDDTFFYCLVFDPTQKTLLADKGEIRVGARYQTDLQQMLKPGDKDDRVLEELETLVWTPQHSLTDKKIDQFLVVSRSVGTFARALDCTSSVKQPSLHMSAAAASQTAMCSLVPSSGPVLCRDEMEEWSASEANLFEDALEKYGKDFNDIRNDFVSNWEKYYYMWKTTDRYVQQKRVKAVEAESKLKQVYIPNYTKPSPALITNNNKSILNGNSNGSNVDIMLYSSSRACESCATTASPQWYSWGPAHLSNKLCQSCWNYWKRYGGLKVASRLADNGEIDPSAATINSSNTASPVSLKKRSAGSDLDEDLTIIASSGPLVAGVGIPGGTSVGSGLVVGATAPGGAVVGGMSNHRPHSPSFKCSIVNCGKEFKLKAHLARHYAQAHGIQIRSGSPRPIMKTRTAFYLHTTLTTRLSRRLCRHIIRSKKAARQPSYAINIASVKQEFAQAETGKSSAEIRRLLTFRKKERGSVTHIANRLGNPGGTVGDWLLLTPKDRMPKPDVVAFPKPPKAPDGTLLYERIPNKCDDVTLQSPSSTPGGVGGGKLLMPTGTSAAANIVAAVGGALSGKLAPLVGSGGLAVTPIVIGSNSSNSTSSSSCTALTPSAGGTTASMNLHATALTSGNSSSTNSSGNMAQSPNVLNSSSGVSSLKRRTYEDSNGVDGTIAPPAKRPNKDPMPSHRPTPEQYAAMIAAAQSAGQPLPRHHMNGKPKIAQMARTGSGRKQVISWNDAPDDVFYRSTKVGRLPAQLSAQLAAASSAHPVAANLNLNLNAAAAAAAAAAALVGAHPLTAASSLALSGTLGGVGGGAAGVPAVSSPVGASSALACSTATGAGNSNANSSTNNSGSSNSSNAIAADSKNSELQVVILD